MTASYWRKEAVTCEKGYVASKPIRHAISGKNVRSPCLIRGKQIEKVGQEPTRRKYRVRTWPILRPTGQAFRPSYRREHHELLVNASSPICSLDLSFCAGGRGLFAQIMPIRGTRSSWDTEIRFSAHKQAILIPVLAFLLSLG